MMNRYPRTDPWPIGIWSACLMLLIAVAAAPAQAQTPQAAAAEAEEVSASTGDEADDDDLLEPSNTGYVDDATIGTRIRLRFDAAFGADAPDRAEFLYAKCGCFRNPALRANPLQAAFDAGASGPGKVPEADVDYRELEIAYEHAFADGKVSLFAELPIRSINLGDNQASFSGLSDLRVGAKFALVKSPDRYLTFQLRAYVPTGESEDGLGTDHYTLEPGLLLFQRLNDRLTLGAELKYWYPTSGNVGLKPDATQPTKFASDPSQDFSGEILRYGIGLSYDSSGSSALEWSPVAELVGWNVLGGFKTVASADGDEILNLKLGTRIRGSFPGSFYVGYGFALTDEVWYDGVFRFEYRVAG